VRTLAPLQFGALAKTVVFIFFALCILWGVANYIVLRDVLLSWVLLAINGVLALVLGWLFYKRMQHTIFSYDQDGFEIQMGRRQASGQWQDFSGVSLVHLGYGSFAVRLYKDHKASLDIPASSLRLDPSEFRFEVMRLVSGEPDKG
jgi:hypothetical protein